MPVAISNPDPVNSAAQFIDGVAKGDAASRAKSQAADANYSDASLVSKDRKSSDEDFDAVLAMLLNGGIPPLQAPVLPVAVKEETNAAESGTSSALDTDTASQASAKVAASSSENTTTAETAESANANGLRLAGTTSTTFTSAMETAAATQKGQGVVSSQVTEDLQASSMQVLPVVGAAAKVDASAISFNISVLSEAPALVSAKPLSKEIMQALERIGRPPESKLVADEIPKPITADEKVSTPTSQNLALTSGETQASADSIDALNATSAVVSATATTPALKTATTTSSEQAIKGTTDQEETLTSDLKTFVSGLEDSPLSAATLIRFSPSETVEARPGITATIGSSKSIPDNAISDIDLIITANEQLQRQIESVKQDALSNADALASDRLESQTSSNSDLTAAAIQSGLTSSASPNSVPDLAASISAEIRQPLTSQVSQAIMDHVARNGVRQSDSLSVRLDPPELGEMTIQLSKTHEGIAVRVTAREAVTMDMLFARGQEIESQLRGQHLNLKSLEFQRADMSHSGFPQGQGQPQQQNNSSRRSENLLNQIRGGTRGLSPISTSVGSLTPDSSYGLSFRA